MVSQPLQGADVHLLEHIADTVVVLQHFGQLATKYSLEVSRAIILSAAGLPKFRFEPCNGAQLCFKLGT